MHRSWFARAQTTSLLLAAALLASCPRTITTTSSAASTTGATGTGGGGAGGMGGAGVGGEPSGPCVLAGTGGEAGAPPASQAVAFQLNARHDGFQPGSGLVLPLVKKWSVDLHGSISYPLIAEGRVFVTVGSIGDLGTTLYALDAHTGAMLWEPVFMPGSEAWSNAAYDRGKVFVINFEGNVRAFDAATGALLWSIQVSQEFEGVHPPTAFAGTLFIGAGDAAWAVDEASGKILWKRSLSWGTSCVPVVDRKGVYLPVGCEQAAALCPSSGAVLWHRESECIGEGERTAVLFGDRLYLRAKYQPNRIVDAATGVDQGTFESDEAPAFDGVRAFFLSKGALRAEDLATGETLWSFSGEGGKLVSAPIIAGDQIYVGSELGELHALDTVTGNVLWSGKVGAAIHAPRESDISAPFTGLATADGVLVVPADHFLVGY